MNDYFDLRPSSMHDREPRSPRSGPSSEYRITSDRINRPRDARDRSSSPGRNRGGRQPGSWDDRER